jgi:hypothetical protein
MQKAGRIGRFRMYCTGVTTSRAAIRSPAVKPMTSVVPTIGQNQAVPCRYWKVNSPSQ